MGVVFSDDFNRADAPTLGPNWYNYGGPVWSYTIKNMKVRDQMAVLDDDGQSSYLFAMARPAALSSMLDSTVGISVTYRSDTTVYGTIKTYARYGSASSPPGSQSVNAYCMEVATVGEVFIVRRLGSTNTFLASYTSGWNVGDTFAFTCRENSLSIKRNGSTLLSTTDSNITSPGFNPVAMTRDQNTSGGLMGFDDFYIVDPTTPQASAFFFNRFVLGRP